MHCLNYIVCKKKKSFLFNRRVHGCGLLQLFIQESLQRCKNTPQSIINQSSCPVYPTEKQQQNVLATERHVHNGASEKQSESENGKYIVLSHNEILDNSYVFTYATELK